MGERVDGDLDEIIAANAKAFEKARQIVEDFKAVVEYEVLMDDSVPKSIEINPSPQNP